MPNAFGSVKRFWSLGLLAIILYSKNALEIERNYSGKNIYQIMNHVLLELQ